MGRSKALEPGEIMSLSIDQIVTPIYFQILPALSVNLGKAEEHAKARKIEPEALLKARLFPDMYPLDLQVQTACDQACRAMARLAGLDLPKFADTEKSFDELRQRIDKALAFIKTITPAQLAGAESREIKLVFPTRTLEYTGLQYLTGFALPNFYFHATTAYAILRHNGVELGKRDFMGRT
jgi:hypothetical protein